MIHGSKSTYTIARSNNVLFQIVHQGVLQVADFDTKSSPSHIEIHTHHFAY
jgi:hypothetical protein